jgi:hypothetical protein
MGGDGQWTIGGQSAMLQRRQGATVAVVRWRRGMAAGAARPTVGPGVSLLRMCVCAVEASFRRWGLRCGRSQSSAVRRRLLGGHLWRWSHWVCIEVEAAVGGSDGRDGSAVGAGVIDGRGAVDAQTAERLAGSEDVAGRCRRPQRQIAYTATALTAVAYGSPTGRRTAWCSL